MISFENIIPITETISKHFCELQDNLHYPSCIRAIEECLYDSGINQLVYCVENFYFFYQGI